MGKFKPPIEKNVCIKFPALKKWRKQTAVQVSIPYNANMCPIIIHRIILVIGHEKVV